MTTLPSQEEIPPAQSEAKADDYLRYYDDNRGGDANNRKANYTSLVNTYYDLVTDFYEFGWGQSFHFAPRKRGESFRDSLRRHEHYIADRLGLVRGLSALDVGCGVGGPMRAIAQHTGARVVGINNNGYQIERAQRHNRKARLEHLCELLRGDFMQIPVQDGTFDAAYGVEATCHAPDRAALFREIRRVLKPGGMFAVYEWCLTDRFDPHNLRHQEIKRGIEEGDALPELAHTHVVDAAFESAGFEILDTQDLTGQSDPETPWYLALTGRERSLSALPRTPFGRMLTNRATGLLERVGLAPKGTKEVSDFLMKAADALVAGGELGIFTPMYFVLARAPK